MSQEIISPLSQIIRRAAESKVVGPIAAIKRRMADASDEVVLLVDTSSSMIETVGGLGMRKCEHLAIAVKDVLPYHPRIRIISFGLLVKEVATADKIPSPSGGTPLAKALILAQKYKPRKTIIVSDGQSTDAEALVIHAAEVLTGTIDCIYCGQDGDYAAAFLQSLCRDSGGVSFTWDGYKGEIGSRIRGLLGAPTP